jgi:hypothetical protein
MSQLSINPEVRNKRDDRLTGLTVMQGRPWCCEVERMSLLHFIVVVFLISARRWWQKSPPERASVWVDAYSAGHSGFTRHAGLPF